MTATPGRKTVNPRQGIETLQQRKRWERLSWLCRKTVNPRQGIETALLRVVAGFRNRLSRKTVNPRQGIETRVLGCEEVEITRGVGRQ